jgi:hypothetical protein
MLRRAALLVTLALGALATARPALAADDAGEAQALLATIETAGAPADRLAAATRLAEIGGRVIEPLAAYLARTRATSVDERRAVLAEIRASVPDPSGRFQAPGREQAAQIRADDEFDWLAALAELPAMPGLAEVLGDVAALRALAISRHIEAGRVILEVAFADDTMIYRDECGRRLRAMAPYSLPALIVASQARKNSARARYATYQLERLDRQDPDKALLAGEEDEDLQIAILAAYGKTEMREAVAAVFRRIDHGSPRVRAAARAAWLEYVSPPHPPEAPKQKLKLAGGQTTDKEQPLWLNSLELARYQLTRRLDELFGETLPPRGDLIAATQRLFAHHDAERAARDARVFAEGQARIDAGDLPGAIALFDRLLAEDPERAERAAMAPTYLARADALAAETQWAEASALYSKAHGLDPEGPRATEALAAHYYTLGKAAEADGKDGGASFRRAAQLRPDYAPAREAAAAAAAAPSGKRWMLYLAGGAAAGAALLLLVGLVRRRAV